MFRGVVPKIFFLEFQHLIQIDLAKEGASLFASWAPMVPLTKSRLGLNDAETGLALLMFGIGAFIALPLTALLVNRWGSQRLILFSGSGMSTLIPFLTVVPSFVYLALALFLFGASTSAMNISLNSQALMIESQAKRPLMPGFHCLFSVGGFLGVTLVGLILTLHYALLYCGLIVSTFMALILMSQYRKLLKESQPIHTKNRPFVFPEKGVLILGLLCFVAFMAEGSMFDWSAEYLRTFLNYSASQVGIGYALFSIGMATGRLAGNQLITRFNPFHIFQVGSLFAACGFFILISAPMPYAELLGFCMIGLGAANVVPILFSASGKFSKTPSHIALAAVTSLGYLGLLSGPGIIGLLANFFSLPLALSMVAGLLILAGTFGPSLVQASASNEIKKECDLGGSLPVSPS